MPKSKLRRIAQRLLYTAGISGLWGRQQAGMRILMFHGVGGEEYPEAIFSAQMRFLQQHFLIVSLEQMVAALRRGESPSPPWVALTFDDGLKNNYTLAYPILKNLGIPATFFVCPALIDRGRWLWNCEARERLRTLGDTERALLCRLIKAPTGGREEIIEWLKTLPLKPRISAENQIRAMTPGFLPNPAQRRRFDIMSWQDLESISGDASGLFSIGSHTMNHPILTKLLPGEIEFELKESQKILSEKLSRQIDLFCYPNGSYHQGLLAAVRRYYRCAVTTQPGIASAACDPHQLPRIATAEQIEQLAWRMSFAPYREAPTTEEIEQLQRSPTLHHLESHRSLKENGSPEDQAPRGSPLPMEDVAE